MSCQSTPNDADQIVSDSVYRQLSDVNPQYLLGAQIGTVLLSRAVRPIRVVFFHLSADKLISQNGGKFH